MPTWTLAELCSAATRRVGQRSDLPLSLVSFWANQALQDFAYDLADAAGERVYLFSASSSDYSTSLPSDFLLPIAVSTHTTTPARILKQISADAADARGYAPSTPSSFFIWANAIYVYPPPNSTTTFALRYRAIPSTLTELTSVPEISQEHRLAILLKLEQYLHEELGNLEEANLANARYNAYVSKLRDAMARRQYAKNLRISIDSNSLPRYYRKDDFYTR